MITIKTRAANEGTGQWLRAMIAPLTRSDKYFLLGVAFLHRPHALLVCCVPGLSASCPRYAWHCPRPLHSHACLWQRLAAVSLTSAACAPSCLIRLAAYLFPLKSQQSRLSLRRRFATTSAHTASKPEICASVQGFLVDDRFLTSSAEHSSLAGCQL